MTAASNPSISDPKTETEPRSCRVIFTCVKMKIATLPLVYKGATLFTPKKLGNLQGEIAVCNRVKADLDKARSSMFDDAFMSYWEKRNDELRNLGIKTVALGED